MDALIVAAQQRQRPSNIAFFLIMRYTGMRRESVATLQVRHLDGTWGLRRVPVKGGQTRDIPLPESVMTYLHTYVERLAHVMGQIGPDTPLFWSLWGRRTIGKSRAPMQGKNIWRLCKTYRRSLGTRC